MNVLPFAAGQRPEDVALLGQHSFLAHIGPRDFGAFIELLDQVALPAGTEVFRQGDEGEQMFFVLEGHARVIRGGADIARLGPGDHFGELSILGQTARTTTVATETVVRLARLSRARFISLGAHHPSAALHFMEALAGTVAAKVTALRDDVVLARRSLPRRPVVDVTIRSERRSVGTGTLAGTLLPRSIDGGLVVAATVDRRAVSLETPLMADASVDALTTATWEGRRVFRRSACLLVLEAARRALPGAVLTVGPRIALRQVVLTASALSAADVATIQHELDGLVERAEPLREELWTIEEARVQFAERGWADAAALLASYRAETVTLLACGGTIALAFGPVVGSAALLRHVTLATAPEGLVVDFGPELAAGSSVASMTTMLAARTPTQAAPGAAHQMAHDLCRWLGAMHATSVGTFNECCVDGRVDELIRVSEGFHEKHIGRVADMIAERNLRVVAIAGPSSSGKTTFIRRLKVQLEVNGITPVHLSLDDYYVDRERTPRDESGELDFESVEALDLPLLRADIARLVAGERVRLARYDFPTGKSLPGSSDEVVLAKGSVLLVEGLHALNPAVAGSLPRDTAFRVFVHPATALPLDRLSAVLPDDVRLLRRIVRDRHGRGYTARDTIARWPSVRRGEERHVFPYASEADFVFDTSLVYEVAVLRVFAERYLLEVPPDDPAFVTAHRLRQLIDRFVPIYPDHVPRTSILREFIGGGFDVT